MKAKRVVGVLAAFVFMYLYDLALDNTDAQHRFA